jgi:hypothetical protein
MSSQVFVSVKREAGEEERIVVTEVEVCWLWRREPGAKEWEKFLEADKERKYFSLGPPGWMQPCWHLDFSPNRTISGFWFLEPYDHMIIKLFYLFGGIRVWARPHACWQVLYHLSPSASPLKLSC